MKCRSILEDKECQTAAAVGGSCLVLPAITHVEFTTFHNALFAAENDASLDFVTLIKVAEALGVELVSYSTSKNGDTLDFTPLPPLLRR